MGSVVGRLVISSPNYIEGAPLTHLVASSRGFATLTAGLGGRNGSKVAIAPM
jgi:hypothetical protein